MNKIRQTAYHLLGGFLMGASLFFLITLKDGSDGFQVGIRFAMFMALLALGLSYLGE